MKLTSKECADILGVSAKTIQRRIQKGILSGYKDDNGIYMVEKSEFYRVYPDAHQRHGVRHDFKDVEALSKLKEEMLEERINALERERNALKEQLDLANKREATLLESVKNNSTLLLENSKKENKKRRRFLGIF